MTVKSDPSNPSLRFLCVGPQRTASSWLHQQLLPHPKLCMPAHVKETMFFNRHFDKGLNWYWAHFEPQTDDCLFGEIAPMYFDLPEVIERLKMFSDLRIIINVRDPVERTYSLFRHHRSRGDVGDDYFEAVRTLPRIETSGRYAEHCPRWEAAFGRERCLYLVQDDIQTDPQAVVDRLCAFLGVESIALPPEASQPFGQATSPRSRLVATWSTKLARGLRARRLHGVVELAKRLRLRNVLLGAPGGEERMSDAVREHLRAYHAEDVAFLEQHLGRRFENWDRA